MELKRTQFTLFLEDEISEQFEFIRKKYNPAQYSLIKSHVTLCREDELEKIDNILLNIESLQLEPILISFGKPKRFSNGTGVLIPSRGSNKPFHDLRNSILRKVIDKPRKHSPHITLMHPRNSICTDEIFKSITTEEFPKSINFKKINFIQQEYGEPWRIIKEFKLDHSV